MNNVSIGERARKYIIKTDMVLKNLRATEKTTSIGGNLVKSVIDEAKRYFEDAKYYFERKEYEVSLASIAYCEGLLDSLRMLGLVMFEW
ncbi:MAG: DUF357 domain-containing protein [Candidatus Bathyarchaeia archaeon]|nr:DUF357 domain-containing protein [Candidatus Bathyarchaeota archaeon]